MTPGTRPRRLRARRLNPYVLTLMLLAGSLIQPAGVAYARTELGGMNLTGYCSSHGGGYAVSGGNVNNWSCQGVGSPRGIDMNSVCQSQYGSGAFPAYRNFNDAGSWYCYTDNPSQQPQQQAAQQSQQSQQQQSGLAFQWAQRLEAIRQAYRDLLGREADSAGLDYYANSGWSIDQIRSNIMSGTEYRQRQQQQAQSQHLQDWQNQVRQGDGLLITSGDGRNYQIIGGQRHFVPDQATFNTLYSQNGGRYQSWASDDIMRIPAGSDVPSVQQQQQAQQQQAQQQQAQQQQQQAPYSPYLEGAIVVVCSGSCSSGSGNDWWLTNGQRRRIPDEATWEWVANQNGRRYFNISQADLNRVPQGADVASQQPQQSGAAVQWAQRLEAIRQAYRDILGREADPDGLNNYANSTLSIDDIRTSILNSAECQQGPTFGCINYWADNQASQGNQANPNNQAASDVFTYPLSNSGVIGYDVQNQQLAHNATCFRDPKTGATIDESALWHAGEDWFAPVNTTVQAVAKGTVRFAGNQNYPGWVVIIEHDLSDGSTVYSMYGHLNTPLVSVGQAVAMGDPIGTVVYQTTKSGQPNFHLHWEIRTFLDGRTLPFGAKCAQSSGIPAPGYTWPNQPDSYGYMNPSAFVAAHQPG